MSRPCIVPLAAVLLAAALCGNAPAGIEYSAETDTILVSDYPAFLPCTLDRLRKVDTLFGWGKVTRDEASDTYTVSARLVIGANDGSHTYLQVGSPEHPNETLRIENDLYVAPHWIKGVNSGRSWWQDAPQDIVNRLTLGVEGDDTVNASLVVAGGKVHVGRGPGMDGKTERLGGQIFAFYSTIAEANPAPAKPYETLSNGTGIDFAGAGFNLDHATISGFSGFIAYGLQHTPRKTRYAQLTDTVFENGGAALVNGDQQATGCTFRNLTVGVMDYGCVNAVLTDCTFENNRHNWALTYTSEGLTLVDCTFDESSQGDIYRCWKDKTTGKMRYPTLAVKRHVVVAVTDADGKPVNGTRVTVRCDQGVFETVANRAQVTGPDGRTPGRGSPDALLLTDYTKRATDRLNQPEENGYSYTIEAEKTGAGKGRVEGYRPTGNWSVVAVVLTH